MCVKLKQIEISHFYHLHVFCIYLHGNCHMASNFLAEAIISLALLFALALFSLSRHPSFFALCKLESHYNAEQNPL